MTTGHGDAAQVTAIRALLDTGRPGAWAVKDSFCTLDLAPLGFQLLFEATWIWRSPAQGRPDSDRGGIRWATVKQAGDLANWETPWNGSPPDPQSESPARIFVPALLADEKVVFIAGYQD